MARYPNKKGENCALNEEQKQFVKDMHLGMSDESIANDLGLSIGVINYYRRQILGITKGRLGRFYKIPKERTSIFEIQKELTAIQKFANYPSFMNGAKERVKYLESVLKGIR